MATVINGSGDSTFNGNIIQLDSSPEYHFATDSATHYNWRIAAQEQVNGGFEIASGTQTAGSNASSDTYTNRLVIDSAGRVTMPYQPSFSAWCNVNELTSVGNPAPFTATRHNNGNHFDGGTRRFNVPVTGYYQFNHFANVNGVTSGYGFGSRFYVNGSAVSASSYQISTGGWQLQVNTEVIYCTAGDYVDVRPSHQSAHWDYGSTAWSSFSGHLLG